MSDLGGNRQVVILSCEYPPFSGGTGSYSANVVAQLRAAGVPVLAIVPHYPELPPLELPYARRLLRHHRIDFAAGRQVMRLLSAQPRDAVVLAADIRSVLLAGLWSRLTGRPYRVMVHGSEAIKFRNRSPLRSIVRAAYKRADMISTNSAATLGIFERSFGRMRQGKINHLGVDESWFGPPPTALEHAALAALAPDARIVTTIGRVEDRKGQLETIAVLAAARRDHALGDIIYVIAGHIEEPAQVDRIRAAAAAEGVPLIVTGRVSDNDVKLLFRRALIHILLAQRRATKIEGFGLVLLEAAAQHCPSLSTRIGGIPEVLGEDSEMLFEPEDIGGMAAAMAKLCNEPDYRERIASLAEARSRLFTWRACVEGTFPEIFAHATT